MWDDSYHIRNVVRVHLIQILIIDVRIGKVKPVEQWLPGLLGAKTIRTRIWPKAQLCGRSPQHQVSDVEQVAQERTAVILLTGVHLRRLLHPHLSQGVLEHTEKQNWLLGYNRGQPKTHLLNLITEIPTRLDLVPAPARSFWSLMMSMSITINSSSCRGLHRLLNGLRQYVFPSTSATGERGLAVSAASFQQRKTHK